MCCVAGALLALVSGQCLNSTRTSTWCVIPADGNPLTPLVQSLAQSLYSRTLVEPQLSTGQWGVVRDTGAVFAGDGAIAAGLSWIVEFDNASAYSGPDVSLSVRRVRREGIVVTR